MYDIPSTAQLFVVLSIGVRFVLVVDSQQWSEWLLSISTLNRSLLSMQQPQQKIIRKRGSSAFEKACFEANLMSKLRSK